MRYLVTNLMAMLVGCAGLLGAAPLLAAERAAAPAAAAPAAAAAAAPSAVRGGQLYTSVGCVHCHGSQGQGSTAGARLAPEPLPATAIAQFIRATNTTMPAYSAQVLSDADVADIAAFLATVPAAKPVARIPALRDLQAPGR
jgi:mono/diheme cytochrome c family protein